MKWISVENRLPELFELQLASASPYNSAKASKKVLVYRNIENWDEEDRIQIAYLRQVDDKEPTWSCGSNVTHWSFLIDSPNESDSNSLEWEGNMLKKSKIYLVHQIFSERRDADIYINDLTKITKDLVDLIADLRCKEGCRKYDSSKSRPLCYQCGRRHDLILQIQDKFGIKLKSKRNENLR